MSSKTDISKRGNILLQVSNELESQSSQCLVLGTQDWKVDTSLPLVLIRHHKEPQVIIIIFFLPL